MLILDPPRTGLPKELSQALLTFSWKKIVYLSCDPGTLARDLGLFSTAGFTLATLRGFDLFPQTPHIETLALLEPHPRKTTSR